MKVLGILPARGGSKGLPGKNIRPCAGKPLLAWAASAMLNCDLLARRICSTDDPAIAAVAEDCGLELPFMRPAELAADDTPAIQVLQHALAELDPQAEIFTHVLVVQATSPTVKADDIARAIHLAETEQADTVITAYPASRVHPSLMFSLDDQRQPRWLLQDGSHAVRRQEQPDFYIRTGLLYLIRTATLQAGQVYGDRLRSLMIDEQRAIAIDDEQDFQRAQQFLMQGENHGSQG